jgi:hypothetical protein
MCPGIQQPLNLSREEVSVLADMLESERARLLVEIRHTHHRAFRTELQQRLAVVEGLAGRCANQPSRDTIDAA